MHENTRGNAEYKEWIKSICQQFRNSQIKAFSRVNAEMLQFYWNLGKDIARREVDNIYRSGFSSFIPKQEIYLNLG